jgi:arylsulfatase A-like enzyme
MESRHSFVLVTVDCLRADHCGFLGYDCPTTPFLDALATQSWVFTNAIVAGTPTYYSLPAILASRYPLALGRDMVGLAPEERTIASQLKMAGYATGAFLAGNPYLSPRFGYQFGLETFRDFLDAEIIPLSGDMSHEGENRLRSRLNRSLEKVSHQLGPLGSLYDELYFRYGQRKTPPVHSIHALRRFPAADAIVNEASSWLASVGERPFFLWLHLMDPHSPYYPPEEAIGLMSSGHVSPERARYLNSYWNRGDVGVKRFAKRRQQITALYDAGIRWADKEVGRLVEMLRRSGRWQNCIFALTADHGEEFLEHGDRYHAPSKLTEELIRVPLLLCVPGARKSGNVCEPFSLLHLAPTLLDAAGVQVPQDFRGISHWERLQNGQSGEDAAIVECVADCTNPFRATDRLGPRILAVREARYKMVLDFRSNKVQLFDLESDPAEIRPLPGDLEKPVRRRLLEAAHLHVRHSQQACDPALQLKARLNDLRGREELSKQ